MFHLTTTTVESRYNGPASKVNPPLTTEAILKSLEVFLDFYIGDDKNPPITDKNGWNLEIGISL